MAKVLGERDWKALAMEATGSFPDPSEPIDIKMLRTATLPVNAQDGSKTFVVGNYIANGGNIDGIVERIQLFPGGSVVATVSKKQRSGAGVSVLEKHIVVRGDFDGEVMSAAERAARFG